LVLYILIIAIPHESREKEENAASAISAVPKSKKIKVLTHQPRYIETVVVPKFGEGTSSTAEARQIDFLKVPTAEPVEMPKNVAEAKEKAVKKLELEETIVPPEILSPLEAELPKVAKAPATTPKRRRMASVLDAVMETTRSLTPTVVEKVAEAVTARVETEARPSAPAEAEPAVTEHRAREEFPDAIIALEKNVTEKTKSPAPEAPSEDLDYIIRHASGKRLSKEGILEAKHYVRELKYSKGALVFNGMDEDDFLYCLPDNKEISVCREMAKSMGFPKLEVGLSAMSKYDLADSLAYNSLKVQKL
jgi:hypothetical protein